jgi:hypothetical protein
MATPFPSVSPALCGGQLWGPAYPLHLLLVAAPGLSGDGQLREVFQERRSCLGGRASIWYLTPELVVDLALGSPGEEAVAAADPAVIAWLELRFGGIQRPSSFTPQELDTLAPALPPQVQRAWG